MGCFAGTSHKFSKSTFEMGKNICKLDDYFEYEIDGGYTFTSEEVYIFFMIIINFKINHFVKFL